MFKISGEARRKEKKKLAGLKSLKKDYWYYHNMDKDMASFYGSTGSFPMNDEDAQTRYDELENEINALEIKLTELV